ncbi:MAG: LysR family transcriptional regulator [Veillonella sp.]|nr:LysR family transcriptional regulator [Veillonella sp.]MCF0156241.1 LysR family transcriptional regulator [Veillonella sp.]
MNHKDLVLYKTLFEEKNITHTAKRLFLSQPSISDRIKKLEQEFNCSLIIREARGIQFTQKGEQLYEYCLRSLKEYEEIREQLQLETAQVRGTLEIVASNIFARYLLPTLLKDFHQVAPYVKVAVKTGFSHNLYRMFLEGKYPIAIVRGDHNWSEHSIKLWEEPLCVFNKEEFEISELADMPYIRYTTDPALLNIFEEWWYANFKTRPNTIIEVDNIDMCMKLVQEGLGFTLLSHTVRFDHPEFYHKHLKDSEGKDIMLESWICYRNNYESLDHVKAFIDFMDSIMPVEFDKPYLRRNK